MDDFIFFCLMIFISFHWILFPVICVYCRFNFLVSPENTYHHFYQYCKSAGANSSKCLMSKHVWKSYLRTVVFIYHYPSITAQFAWCTFLGRLHYECYCWTNAHLAWKTWLFRLCVNSSLLTFICSTIMILQYQF